MGTWIDSIKFAGEAFTLFPQGILQEFIAIAHHHQVEVSTGGFIEYVITQGSDAVNIKNRRPDLLECYDDSG
jgi:phosphosulfolactate synthase (CoM biosynthesis protein A)